MSNTIPFQHVENPETMVDELVSGYSQQTKKEKTASVVRKDETPIDYVPLIMYHLSHTIHYL